MSTVSKYEIVEKSSTGVILAKHVRLDRHVQLHRFTLGDLSDDGKHSLLHIATKLATIDHPQIPHLLDFIQTDNAYLLVLESHPGERLADCLAAESDVDPMRAASRAERIADALSHAHQRGLAHGALTIDDILIDTLGQPKISGIGLRQLRAGQGHDTQELVDRDMRSLGGILLASLPPLASNNSSQSGAPAAIIHDDSKNLSDLRKLAKNLAAESDKSTLSLESAHRFLQQWLERESLAREARELSVEPALAADAEAPALRSKKPLLAACAAIGCLLTLVVAMLFWSLPTESSPEPTSAATLTEPPQAATTATDEPDSSETLEQASPLSQVGVLNNPNVAEPSSDNEPAADVQDAITSAPPKEDLVVGDLFNRGSPSVEEKPASDSLTIKQTPAEPEQQPSDPFANVPRVISLPKTSVADVSTLFDIDLEDDDRLALNLLGGVGARPQAEMVLLSATQGSWRIISRNKGSDTEVAVLTRGNGALMFQWQGAGATAVPDALRNTILHLASDNYDAFVALREPTVLEAVKVTLLRNLQLSIDIKPAPKLDDVFLEFVSTDDALVSAIGINPVSVLDGELQLGLDAGNESLILMKVASLMKKGRGLLLTPLSRSTPSAAPANIGADTPRVWQRDLVLLRRQTIAAKGALRKAEPAQRRLMRQQLTQMASEIQQREKWIDAYTAALEVSLSFRIFRRIGEHEMDLVHVGAVSGTEDREP